MITKYDVLRKPLITEKIVDLQQIALSNVGFRKEAASPRKEESANKRSKGYVPKSNMKKIKEERPFSLVAFKVHPEATKTQIKEAVEEFFNVKVESVRTMNYVGKEKRFGRTVGRRNDWKKAIVTLKDGEKLEFI